MEAAVGELEVEYGDRADFVIVSAEDTQNRMDEIVEYGFEAQKHGLVVFDAEGTARAKLPGHSFLKPEIEEALTAVLAD